ncbi:MAG: suppressor of fused domain protein [Ruminiclostridium sp.]|nr:suppressor of fused domain protein [Ruminiclostridium sp.]MDE6724536.1 suppressor of fused domain protein [Ruminiclostridium sp.]
MNNESGLQELYSNKDSDILKKYIKKHYGKTQSFYRDYSSSGVHPDIAIIPPNFAKPFYTLVTTGLGAHKINPPASVPLNVKADFHDRVEFILTLEKNWPLDEKTEEIYWPLHLLRDAAKLAAEKDCCFGEFPVIEMPKYYDPLNKFMGALLVEPEVDISDDSSLCKLSDGSSVKFLQFIPLFREEIRHRKEHGGEPLYKALRKNLDLVYCVNPERRSVF